MIFPNLKCYNFVSQNVSSLPNESLTFCSTNSQFINVRKNEKTTDIYVEISDLNDIQLIQNRFQVPFKNVDKIIYCEEGNYLALVGIDSNQFAKICVYFNWWIDQKSETKSKCILNQLDDSKETNETNQETKPSSMVSKSYLEYVEIKTDYFKEEEAKNVKISCCERSGNLLIGYVNKIQIYKYFKKYSFHNRSLSNNFVHLLDVKIKFDAEHFKLTEQLLLCSSIEHCQVINLDFQAEIHLSSSIRLDQSSTENSINEQPFSIVKSNELNSSESNEQTIHIPLFQNEQLKIVSNGHLNEIIGPINDKLCCRIDVKFDNCLQINNNNINILFCLNLVKTKVASLVEQQFEIIEEDGYSQIHVKNKNEITCKTFLLPIYEKYLNDKQLDEDNNPLSAIENQTQNPLHSMFNSKLIYFNFFVFKNDCLSYYLIDHNFKVEKFKLNQMDIKNFNLKSVSIDESFIYILTKDSLYTYYFGLFNILNHIHHLKFTSILDQNLNELLKTVRPLLLNKNLFLGSHQLINNPVQLMLLSQDNQIFTKYRLKKPTHKQSLNDAKENLAVLEQELNQKQKINLYFYLINLCKSIKLDKDLNCLYLDYSLILLKLLIINFPVTSKARKLIMEFVFKYTDLKLIDLIQKDNQFLFKRYDLLKSNQQNESTKSIIEELLEQLIHEDKLNQTILYSSYYDYEQLNLLSEKVLDNLDDLNVLKLINHLNMNSNLDLIVYLIFKHKFNGSNWSLLKSDLIDKILDSNSTEVLAKSKILFDCEQFDEFEKLILNTNKMNLYYELINYKEFVIPSIDFLAYLIKLDLSKVIKFLHKLIVSNVSSEFIFRIFKDNKLLFILLDNYLCTNRTDQKIPEKLLINLVVNYWKILNNELNYDAICDEFGLKYQWNVYQTPFINLLRPYHDNEDGQEQFIEDGSDAERSLKKENGDKCLEMNEQNSCPDQEKNQSINNQCLCIVCSPTFNKLQFILNTYSSNNEIKSLLNHLIKNNQTNWSWRIQVQISDFSDAISILHDKRPETILFYILEQQTMDDKKWTLLIDFLNKKQKIYGLDSKLNHKVLYHLANILSPLEFIKLIPAEWKPIVNYYFRICIEKYQSKCIKNQIMSYLDKDYVSTLNK